MTRPMRVFALVAVVAVAVLSGCGAGECTPSSCSTGCCDASGTCQTGNTSQSCGIGGQTCNTCLLTQQCMQGACFGGSTGGGSGMQNNGLTVFPTNASVPQDTSLTLSASLPSNIQNREVVFALEQSSEGSLSTLNGSAAVYYAPSSGPARSARIRATAAYNSSISQLIELSIATTGTGIDVYPRSLSSSPLMVGVGDKQTFVATQFTTRLSSLRTTQWFRWPSAQTFAGTYTGDAMVERIYVRDPSTNQYASVNITSSGAPRVSVEISPVVSTVAPNTVVQLTATSSDGSPLVWFVPTNGFDVGSVTQSGAFTAPATAGIYLVAAADSAEASTDGPLAIATIIVQ